MNDLHADTRQTTIDRTTNGRTTDDRTTGPTRRARREKGSRRG